MSQQLKTLRGDTLIEVIFATLIFSIIIVIVTGLMNRGLMTVEAAAERTAARDEVDAQAEALRFIHNGWTAERQNNPETWQFRELWQALKARSIDTSNNPLPNPALTSCAATYEYLATNRQAFVVNTRLLRLGQNSGLVGPVGTASIVTYSEEMFQASPLYPRVVYSGTGGVTSEDEFQETVQFSQIALVEGVFIYAVRGGRELRPNEPEYYDFHIRTCWHPPGSDVPDHSSTIVRLYNPESIQ